MKVKTKRILKNLIEPLFDSKRTYLNISQTEKPKIIIPVDERYFK